MLTWDREGKGYNELILDGDHWTRHLPGIIEAFVIASERTSDDVDQLRQTREWFLRTFDLDATEAPLVKYDEQNGRAPFVLP